MAVDREDVRGGANARKAIGERIVDHRSPPMTVRRLENEDEEKFWEAWIKDDLIFCYKFGKIGSCVASPSVSGAASSCHS